MKNEYRLMNLINDEWVIVAEGDIDACQDYEHEYDPEPQYQLIRRWENIKEWETLIIGCIDKCKECQQEDEAEYGFCNPKYKIIPVV